MKMKKLLALITAGALCLGMSMTAFAEDGSINKVPNTNNGGQPGAGGGTTNGGITITEESLSAAVENGNITPEECQKVLNTLGDPTEIKKAIAEDLDLPANAAVTVLGVMNYEPSGEVTEGSKVTFALGSTNALGGTAGTKFEGLEDGSQIAVLHLVTRYDEKTGAPIYVWEAKVGTIRVLADGVYVDVDLDEFSPVAFIKVMSNGDVVRWNKNGEVISTTTSAGKITTSRKASPKTGE